MTIRIAVLASGGGSNLQALLDAIDTGKLDARIVGVFSDKPNAFALGDAVADAAPDWIVCAGYMRILGAAFVARFRGRVLNIHPSLLPRYRGLHTHARALEAGDQEHGASVHFVIPELDAGAVIAQAAVRVLPEDSPASLAARVLGVEHPLLLHVVTLAAQGRLAEHDGRAVVDGHPLFTAQRLEFSSIAPLPEH